MSIRHRRIALLLAVLLFVGFVFFWIYSHSFIEISVETDKNSMNTFIATNPEGNELFRVETKEKKIRKLIPATDVETLVLQDGKSYYKASKKRSFLGTTRVSGDLSPERDREYVGDNPSACMNYIKLQLYSYDCASSRYTDLSAHIPASTGSPTYVLNPEYPELPVYGLLNIGDEPVVFLHDEYETDYGDEPEDNLYFMNPDLTLGSVIRPELPKEDTFGVINRGDGYVIYDGSFNVIWSYSSVSSQPEKIKSYTPEDSDISPLQIAASERYVATLFSNSDGGDEGLNEDAEVDDGQNSGGGKSKVILYTGVDTYREFSFDAAYSDILFCGEEKICLLGGGNVDVYSFSKEGVVKQHTIGSVVDFAYVGDRLIIAKNDRVLAIDTTTMSGIVDYSFGDYEYCGLGSSDNTSYVVCVVSPLENTAALLIDRRSENITNIDKKILDLSKSSDVDSVSVYKNFVEISPETGELVFDTSTQGYGFNKEILASANKNIGELVEAIGIDQTRYMISNTTE